MARHEDFEDDTFLETLMKRRGVTPMPPSMVRLLMMVAGLAVVATIIAVAWATWPSEGGRVDEETLPIMRAEVETYKIKPEEPGGMVVPNKDSTIFDTLNAPQKEKTVENLLEELEEPMKKEELFAQDETQDETQEEMRDIAKDTPVIEQPKAAEEKPEDPAIKKIEKPVKEPAKISDGKSYVQFAAVKSDADAKTKWTKLQTQYSFLKGLPLRVQKADLGAKGTFYRIQSGPMSLDQAQSTCAKVKSAKGDCLVIK